ncbi:MAG: CaiB/BaiF CoA transferase family protein [Dehalococcoidia bacterium]
MADGVLKGIRLIELGEGIGVAYCGKLFADYGAEVVKVEMPGGDQLRSAPPFRDGGPEGESSGLFAFLNTSKSSVTIDWTTDNGAHLVDRMVERTDVVVHALDAAGRARLGLGAARPGRPGVIDVAITPFGLTGPYRDFAAESLTMTALAGWMFPMGDRDKPPLYAGGPYISYLAGLSAVSGALIALEAREQYGEGQVVDVSALEIGLTAIPFDTVRFSYSGTYRPRSDELYSDNPTAGIYPCADGYVQFQEFRRLNEFLHIIGGAQLEADPRFQKADLRDLDRELLKEAFTTFLPTKNRWELFEECSKERIVISAVPDMRDLYALLPHRERHYFSKGDAGGALDGVEMPGPPVRFDDGEWHAGPPPVLGARTVNTVAELGRSWDGDQVAHREGGN